MSEETKSDGASLNKHTGTKLVIPFQVEADMRKGPPSSAVIKLHGTIEANQNRLISRILTPLHKANVKHMIIDFSDVPQIEPAPLQTLVQFARERKEAGMQHPCSLTGLRLAVVEVIKKSKPGKVFVVYKHLHDAIKSLKLKGLPDLYVAGTKPSGLNMRVMVKVVPHGGRVALVTPYGYIQQQEADLLGKVLRRVSLMEIRNVVIDMGGISYANSHALGSLLNCATAWQKVYGRKAVALAGTKPGIKMALTTLGIKNSTFICENVDDALKVLEHEEKRMPSTTLEAAGKSTEVKTEEEPVKSEVIAEEESPFSILAARESSSTDTWILKNVQAILKKKKKDKDEIE